MAYNNRQDDDVVDEGSTEPTAVAIPEDNESTTEDEFTLIVSNEDPALADLDTNEEIDLAQFEQMETNAFQKKCLDLFKVRSIMKENMMKSGTVIPTILSKFQ